MVDLQDLIAEGTAPAVLACDRAIFTSLPSPTGEGYRLVAWSGGVRPEERQELTRRAPSHGALSGEGDSPRGVVLFRLQSTGRAACALVRVSGAEHTRRGGGRVWTDFLLADAFDAGRHGLHPAAFRAALAATAPVKPPVGSSPLARVDVARAGAAGPAQKNAEAAAAIAALVYDAKPAVVAAGPRPLDLFEDALRMLPAAARAGLEVAGGLRFSPARGVKVTVTDRIEQDTIRATRGQGIESIDFAVRVPPAGGPLAAWLALMVRWWKEGRGAIAAALADRLGDGWTTGSILEVAALCEAIDRGDERVETLHNHLSAQ